MNITKSRSTTERTCYLTEFINISYVIITISVGLNRKTCVETSTRKDLILGTITEVPYYILVIDPDTARSLNRTRSRRCSRTRLGSSVPMIVTCQDQVPMMIMTREHILFV